MRVCLWLIVCMPFVMGCDDPYSAGVPTGENSTASAPPARSSSATPVERPTHIPAGPEADVTQRIDNVSGQVDDESEEFEREVAEVGVGKKGRNYGGGIITEPIRQSFRLRQRIVFLKIDMDMRVFKAANERLPNSHEEFMEKIIKASDIPLPELPAGERFVYDPERGELMVERPRRQP